MAARVDPRKKKEKQQKIALAIGAPLLLIVLFIQVPKLMGSGASAAPAVETTETGTDTTAVTPTDGSSTTPVAGGRLPAYEANFTAGPGQLPSLELFRTKDPFEQQISTTETAPTETTGGGGGGGKPAGGGGDGGKTTGETENHPYISAVLTVNGVKESVNLSATFPAATPVFKLMAISANSVKIGIAGGSLSTGGSAFTLGKGKSVTLLNNVDGARYVIKLLSVSKTAASGSSTTPTSTTLTPTGTSEDPPPPTPPSSVTG